MNSNKTKYTNRLVLIGWVWLAVSGALCFVLASAASGQSTTVVRGKLVRRVMNDDYPASKVRLTLSAENRRTLTAYTGSDGLYYFQNVTPGRYSLRIWNSQNQQVASYSINAESKQYTDIKPVRIP